MVSEALTNFISWLPKLVVSLFTFIVGYFIADLIRKVVRTAAGSFGADTGKLFGYALSDNLQESSALPEPLFTPTTKANDGHDMPISCADAGKLIGQELFERVRSLSISLYRMGAERATAADLILADTKFEFGLDEAGELYLIDEILTPDSSRYWPKQGYAPGKPQPSFDKQFVRDYLESLDWDKTPPPPPLPEKVLNGTLERYVYAYKALVANQDSSS